MKVSKSIKRSDAASEPYNGHSTRADVGSMKAGTRCSLVELHHLLTFLKEPQEGGEGTNIHGMCPQEHAVVEDACDLSKHGCNNAKECY